MFTLVIVEPFALIFKCKNLALIRGNMTPNTMYPHARKYTDLLSLLLYAYLLDSARLGKSFIHNII